MKYLIFILLLFTTSCVSAPGKYSGPTEAFPKIGTNVLRHDVSHVIGPGETLWRLSKMYDVSMSDIVRKNNLGNSEKLIMGDTILIPNAAPLRPVIALYPSNKWKYIIVHHSATDEGNAFAVFKMHSQRGFEGIGYHFVVDNGSIGKGDGQIEVAPRWLKQNDGAHCKASGMNAKGIGICLVGNFSKDRVSKKQLNSLIYLVNVLREYYKIPIKNILGHRQVSGAKTECPGNYFPWEEFVENL